MKYRTPIISIVIVLALLGTAPLYLPSYYTGLVTLMLIHLVTIPVTGTSVNPARSLGPALLSGGKALAQLWLFSSQHRTKACSGG
jgi:aquaporin Z